MIAGHSRRAAGSRSLTGSKTPCRRPPPPRRAPRACAPVVRVELPVDLARAERGVERHHDQRRLGPRQRLHELARPGHQRPLPAQHHGHVGAELHRHVVGHRDPAHLEMIRSAAAASLDPPAMPAAIGIRLVISIRSGGPSHPVAARNSAAPAARGSRPPPRADDLVKPSAPGRGSARRPGRSAGRARRAGQAVGARGADEQAEVDLAGRPPRSCSQNARHSAGLERLGAGVGGLAERDEGLAGAVAHASCRRPTARATSPSPCGGARSRAGRARASSRAAPASGAPGRRAPSRRSAPGGKTLRGILRATFTSQASWASTDGTPYAVDAEAAKRSPTSFCTIATQRRRRSRARSSEDHGRGDPVGQVRDDLGRRRVERVEVELDRVGEVQGGVRERVERLAQRLLQPAVELDDVHVGGALGQVLAEHAEPAADLQHDVVRGQLGQRPMTSRMFESTRKFWPRSRFGRMPNSRMRRMEGLRHQRSSLAAFASTAASSSA